MENLKFNYLDSTKPSFTMVLAIALVILFQPNYSYASSNVNSPSFQMLDSARFEPKELIYVLNGKLLGKGKDKIKLIDVKNIKEVVMSTSAYEVKNFGGDPKKNMIVFYSTYKSEAERRDSTNIQAKRWLKKTSK